MSPVRPAPEPYRPHLSALELATVDQPCAFGLPSDQLIDLLGQGEIEIEGRLPYSSNATLLVTVTDPADHPDRTGQPGRSHRAVYKPGRGERPLRDFPPHLYRREVAMYRLAEALGWDVIPPTTVGTGPLGEGSVQAFVNADFSEHYFSLVDQDIGLDDLRLICALDFMANNTDRKAGHCLLAADGRVYGIDNGLAFHRQFKLRTVIWDFVGEPIPPTALDAIVTLLGRGLPAELVCLLDQAEIQALLARMEFLAETGLFPEDDTGGHRFPWPLV